MKEKQSLLGVRRVSQRGPAEALFSRHLDLAPLRSHGRGLVRCPFHRDRTPSLSLDLDRGLFNCFGCNAHGGLRRFAELVGERDALPQVRRLETPLEEARRRVAMQARRADERAAEWRDWYECNDFIRRSHHAVRQARKITTALGPQHTRTWSTLELAARVESFALAIESELDDILESGRVA